MNRKRIITVAEIEKAAANLLKRDNSKREPRVSRFPSCSNNEYEIMKIKMKRLLRELL